VIDDDPMRWARRLHDEGWCVLHRAWEPLDAGDGVAYGAAVTRAMALFAAASWAAQAPHLGEQLLREHGVDLHEREALTRDLPLPRRDPAR
jgi:hypothetical protein